MIVCRAVGSARRSAAARARVGAHVPVRDRELGVLPRDLARRRARDADGDGGRQRGARAGGDRPGSAMSPRTSPPRSSSRPRGRWFRRRSARSSCSAAPIRTCSWRRSSRPPANGALRRARAAALHPAARARDAVPLLQFLTGTDGDAPLAPSRPRGAARRWFTAVLGVAAAILTPIGALQRMRSTRSSSTASPSDYPPRFYMSLHRYIAPGLAKHADYDTLLSGSSIVENTRNSAIGRACHGDGAQRRDAGADRERAGADRVDRAGLEAPRARILILDFNAFSGAPDQRNPLAGPLPKYLYDRNPANDFPYLLSWGVLVRSWRIVAGDRSERFRTDADAPWWWADEKRFARDEVVKRLDPRDLNAQFQQPRAISPGMQASFRHNLMPLFSGASGRRSSSSSGHPTRSSCGPTSSSGSSSRSRSTSSAGSSTITRELAERPHRGPAGRRGDHARPRPLHRPLPLRAGRQRLAGRGRRAASAIGSAPTTSRRSSATFAGRRWNSIRLPWPP